MHANADVILWESYAPASGALLFPGHDRRNWRDKRYKICRFIPHHLIVEEIEKP
jgi:hypothetical protein